MYLTSTKLTSAGVILDGKVTGAFTQGTPIAVYLQQTCSGERLVAKAKLTRAGTFSVLAPAPSGLAGQLNLFRARTRVFYDHRPIPAWTLPTVAPES
jgi:hypothetical protein